MKVVVTGASGFLGNRVVEKLMARGVEVCAVARQPLKFSNSQVVNNYLDTPKGDVLIHLAENSDRGQVNKIGHAYLVESANIAKALISKGFGRTVFASSAAVYGDRSTKLHKPTDCVVGDDVYAKAKLESEKIFQNSNGVIARLSNLYGIGMSPENVFSSVINQLLYADDIKVWNDKPIRDFLWIDDAADALVAMTLEEAEGIYNVASGRAVSIREFINTALMVSDIDKKHSVTVTKPNEVYSAIMLDISQTYDSFDWIPKMELENGIRYLLNKEVRIQ
tara:strand:- start:516 stop:1352 length:837 start_codon:yes stop_codon:yes gene_type:complete